MYIMADALIIQVLESLETGKWLDEEPFEIHDYFPAAQVGVHERVQISVHKPATSVN